MWLTKKIGAKDTAAVSAGTVSSSGSTLTVQGEAECRTTETVFPYGYQANTPAGEHSAMLGNACLGVKGEIDRQLLPGEIMLRSKGGATILLLNDGEVIVNGQRFIKRN